MPKTVSSGRLKTPIEIQSRLETGRDALNAPIFAWTTFVKCFARKDVLSGGERYDSKTGQRYSSTSHQFTCRFLDVKGITSDMRLVFDGQNYDIRGILPDDQEDSVVLLEATLQDGSVQE